MTHRYHPDPERGDPPEAILWDDCLRCEEQADDLSGLDNTKLRRLLQVHLDGRWDHIPTVTEAVASHGLWEALLVIERLTGVPWRDVVTAKEVASK